LALLRLLPDAGALFASLRQLVQACVLPLLIISTVLRPTTLFAKFLELRFPRWIGRISYSIYLWQMPLQPAGLAERSHQILAVEDRGYFGIRGG
jgi:peptidoglycan/LPS O-acetylase OafA/YrhL